MKDTVTYKGLDPKKKYKMVAVLNELTNVNEETVTPVVVKGKDALTPDPTVSNSEFAAKIKTRTLTISNRSSWFYLF